ncbi:MAG: ABC transporter permease [Candidatus Hatepunaea meridiana]|nr:ABC transporter permease [Candidatus Hatepunaea meridiana]
MNEYIPLNLLNIAIAAGFVLLAGLASIALRLGLAKSLGIGLLRTAIQLGLAGAAIGFVFGIKSIIWVLLLAVVMTAFAGREGVKRLKTRIPGSGLDIVLAISLSSFVVAISVTGVVIGAEPWWTPRIFIPIMGMVLGNSLTGISLALDRFMNACVEKHSEIEARLTLGANLNEAVLPVVRDSIRTGMIPSINAMNIVGVVSLPGMMTGQLLAGADPKDAVLYQIIVMYMLVAATAMGSIIAVMLARRRVFTKDMTLREDLFV